METAPQRKKILVVEDDELLRAALRDKLLHEEFEVLEAGDGEVGLHMALSNHPDLILLDIVMPKMDGMTMLQKMHEDAWGQTAKVIVLTNLSDIPTRKESYGYLVKSDWTLAEVVERIRERLG